MCEMQAEEILVSMKHYSTFWVFFFLFILPTARIPKNKQTPNSAMYCRSV